MSPEGRVTSRVFFDAEPLRRGEKHGEGTKKKVKT